MVDLRGAVRENTIAWVIGLLAGCGYTSQYQPPDNLRARPSWRGNKLVAAGNEHLPQCMPPSPRPPAAPAPRPLMAIDAGGNWNVRGDLLVRYDLLHFHPPFFIGPHPPGPHDLFFYALRGPRTSGSAWSGSTGGGAGGGGGNGSGVAAAVILAVAITAASAVAIGVSATQAERPRRTARRIDDINEFNDKARRIMTTCLEQGATP